MNRDMQVDQGDRWLSASNELKYSDGIAARRPKSQNPLSKFLAVARRSQPLIPLNLEGPLEDFVTRVATLWDSEANRNAYLYHEKRSLALSTAQYISRLPIITTFAPLEQRYTSGQEFYKRLSQPRPFEVPIANSKKTLRSEALEAFYILTRLFWTVNVYCAPPLAPEGNVAYIPYYTEYPAPPKRTRASDLARISMFFRQEASLPEQKRHFSLHSFTRTSIKPPRQEHAVPLTKEYYQEGAGVAAGALQAREKTPLESGIMYFVAKLMELKDYDRMVWVPSNQKPLDSNLTARSANKTRPTYLTQDSNPSLGRAQLRCQAFPPSFSS